MGKFKVFVSYSRHDHDLVAPVVQILRLNKREAVFFDRDSIPAGSKWRAAIEEAIDSAEYVVLFWCVHSCTSEEVEKEYRLAIQKGKRLVPVQFDETPFPEAVGVFQAIDFRSLGVRQHGAVAANDAAPPGPALPRRAMRPGWQAALAAGLAALLVVPVLFLSSRHPANVPKDSPANFPHGASAAHPYPPPWPASAASDLPQAVGGASSSAVLLLAIGLVIGFVSWLAVRRRRRARPGSLEQRMADHILSEVMSRVRSDAAATRT